jgi:hypothetical protein
MGQGTRWKKGEAGISAKISSDFIITHITGR